MSTVTNCDNCGVCCFGMNLIPYTGNVYGKRNYLTQKMKDELGRMESGPMAGDDGCACIWLDRNTGRCIHYKHRPQMCRNSKVGSKACLLIRAVHGVI